MEYTPGTSQWKPAQSNSPRKGSWTLGRSRWLEGQSEADRRLFLGRYFYGAAVGDLARSAAVTPNALSQRLRRLRQSLARALEEEGVGL